VVQKFQEDAPFYVGRDLRYLHFNAATNTWQACTYIDDVSCTDWTLSDTEGESAYGYGYKRLAHPNHRGATARVVQHGCLGSRRRAGAAATTSPRQPHTVDRRQPTTGTMCHGNPNAERPRLPHHVASTPGDTRTCLTTAVAGNRHSDPAARLPEDDR
jgi:hypothetical protein